MQEISVEVHAAAEPEDIWPLLADVSTWPRWAAFDEAQIESGGGLGEVRRFRRGRWVTRERVTRFEPYERLDYELLSGMPVRRYSAQVTLTQTQTGTTIAWHSAFHTKWRGTGSLIRRRLHKFIEETATGLAREAEGRSASREELGAVLP